MSGQSQRGHGINEAGRQAPEAAIAKPRVRFLGKEVIDIDVDILEHIAEYFLEAKVDEIRVEQPAEQELNGKIIHLLFLMLHIGPVRLDPIFRNVLLHRCCDRFINFMRCKLRNIPSPHDMSC